MSDAFKCDRCGEVFAGDPKMTLTRWERGENETTLDRGEVSDLCWDCAGVIAEMLDGADAPESGGDSE